MIRLGLLLGSLFVSTVATADFDFKTEGFITSRYRSFKETPFAKYNLDNFIFVKEEVAYAQDFFNIQASPYIVAVDSKDVKRVKQAGDPILSSIFPTRQKMNLRQKGEKSDKTHWLTDFQELFVSANHESVSLDIGRRIVSLGNLKLLSGWNKFNPTGASFRPTWMRGVDNVKLAWQNESSKVIGYSIFDEDETYSARLLQIDHFVSPVQVSLLTGTWWEAKTVGLALTVDVEGWLFKFESLALDYYGTRKLLKDESQWGGGIERSFAQDWTANFEFYVQSRGAKKKEEYPTHSMTPHQALRGKEYAAGELKWTPDPFYTYSALFLYSFVDQSSLQGLTVAKQWNDNTEVSLGVMIPQGQRGAEFSQKFEVISLGGAYVGAPTQADLTVKIFY